MRKGEGEPLTKRMTGEWDATFEYDHSLLNRWDREEELYGMGREGHRASPQTTCHILCEKSWGKMLGKKRREKMKQKTYFNHNNIMEFGIGILIFFCVFFPSSPSASTATYAASPYEILNVHPVYTGLFSNDILVQQ